MKKLLLTTLIICSSMLCFAQQSLLSYEDIKYLLHNDLASADTFLTAKGYAIKTKNQKKKFNEYTLPIKGGTFVNVNVRADGRRMFIDMQTTEIAQLNLIQNSISQYLNKESITGADILTYTIKNMATIYITTNDTVPYSPIRKNYDIQIVADKNVTADMGLNN